MLSSERRAACKLRGPFQLFFNPEKLVELGDALAAASGAGLDVSRAGRDGEIRNERIFGFAGAVGDKAAVVVLPRQLDRVQGLGDRADLIQFDEDRIADAFCRFLRAKSPDWCRRCRRPPARGASPAQWSAFSIRPNRFRPCRLQEE